MGGTPAAILAALALPWAFASPAAAQATTQVEQLDDNIQVGTAVKKKLNFLVVPVPMVNPALGNGLTLVTGVFYSPVQGGRQWVTGVGAMYTSNGDRALGAAQQADLFNGKLRLTAAGGYGDFQLDYFGSGQNAGAQDRSIRLDEKGLFLLGNVLYQVRKSVYAGARFRYLDLDTSLARAEQPDDPVIPPLQVNSRISGLGPSVEIDTRDSEFMPHKGAYIAAQWLFNSSAFGSDFAYEKLNAAVNVYHPLSDKTVIAARGSICSSSQGAPFYDLCMFGSSNDLRGYEGGRYRDHAMFAVQGELRQQLSSRFGVVAFGGVGAVAPELDRFGEAALLPAGGVGLRVRPTMKVPVNVSIDYAWGKDSQGIYIYVGESF